MVYNPFEVLRKSEGMCREIYRILENNVERPDLAAWYQDRTRPHIVVVSMWTIGSCALKELFAAGYHVSLFGNDNGSIEIWFSKD